MKTLSRRTLLRTGVAGSAAGALGRFIPFTERQAHAQGYPKRIVFVFWSGGTTINQYLPNGTETNFTFNPFMSALDPWKSKLIVLGNLRRAQDNARGSHQAGTAGTWTGARMLAASGTGPWASLPSVDRVIAKAAPQPTPLQTLDLDCMSQDPGNLRSKTLFDHDGRPIQGEQDPSRAFDRLFTDGITTTPGSDPMAGERLRTQRRSVLDLVNQEITALSQTLGGQDRRKLEQHLTHLRAAETRLTPPAGGGPPAPGGPGPIYTPPSRANFPKVDFKANDNFPMVANLHTDLLVGALATDRARIASLQLSQGNGDIVFRWVGVTKQHHALTHDAEFAPGLTNIHKWHYDWFATLLSKMDAVKEGAGSMLDNTVVVFGNELVSGFTHDTDPWPVILAGGGSGRFKTGRFINFPAAGAGARLFPGEAAMNAQPSQTQLLTSLCHYMGAMVPRVGDPTMGPPGPLAVL